MESICIFCELEKKIIVLCGKIHVRNILIHLLVYHVGHALLVTQYLSMDSGREIEAQVLEFEKIEEVFEDRDCEIFDTLFSFWPSLLLQI